MRCVLRGRDGEEGGEGGGIRRSQQGGGSLGTRESGMKKPVDSDQ